MSKLLQSFAFGLLLVSGLMVTDPSPVLAGMGGMGGMMGGSSGTSGESATIDSGQTKKLQGYIEKENLQCMGCHAVSGAGVGPSFALISSSYMNRNDAAQTLANRIANGVGRMPGGFATRAQAHTLAKLILGLVKR